MGSFLVLILNFEFSLGFAGVATFPDEARSGNKGGGFAVFIPGEVLESTPPSVKGLQRSKRHTVKMVPFQNPWIW